MPSVSRGSRCLVDAVGVTQSVSWETEVLPRLQRQLEPGWAPGAPLEAIVPGWVVGADLADQVALGPMRRGRGQRPLAQTRRLIVVVWNGVDHFEGVF